MDKILENSVQLLQKAIFMWEVIEEPRIFQSYKGPMPIKVLGVKREDGFTLLREVQDDLGFFEEERLMKRL